MNLAQTCAQKISNTPTVKNGLICGEKSQVVEFIYREYKSLVNAKKKAIKDESATMTHITSVVEWLANVESRPWCRLSGFIGNGKSTMLQAVKSWFEKTHIRQLFTLHTASEVVRYAAAENNLGNQNFDLLCRIPLLMIDDLGTEPNEVVVYGNKMQPMRDLLYARYDKRLITLFTTNMTDAEFSGYYGERIADRCRELQTKIVFAEKSYRS